MKKTKFAIISLLILANFSFGIKDYNYTSGFSLRRTKEPTRRQYIMIEGVEVPYVGSNSYRVPSEEDSELVMVPELHKDSFKIALGLADKYPDGSEKKPEDIMMIGESGIRKSAVVRSLAAKVGAAFFHISMNQDTTEDDLEGHAIINSETHDTPVFIEGPLIKWAEEGGYLLLDDGNMARPDVLKAIHDILDKRRVKVMRDGKIVNIPLHPDCRLFLAMNPETYEGRAQLGEAFSSRFHQVFMEPYSRESLEIIAAAKLKEGLTQAAKPMLDIYQFVQEKIIVNDSGNEVFSSLSRRYYFSLRKLLAAVDYVNAFSGSEPLVDTVARALCYAFRSRLETKELREKFDIELAKISIDGAHPNMPEILYYEKFYESGANVPAAMIKGWLGGLADTVFANSDISGYVSDLGMLLQHGQSLLRNSASCITTLFPEEVSNSVLSEMVKYCTAEGSDLFDSLRAVDFLDELSGRDIKYAEYLARIYREAGSNALLKSYAGAVLIRRGYFQNPSLAQDIADVILTFTYPDNVTRDTHITLSADVIVSRMIAALGWTKSNNQRFTDRLKELLVSGERPIYRAKAAKALVDIGVEQDAVKEEMLECASSNDANDQMTAALIAVEALTRDMMNSDPLNYGKQVCKEAIIKLSKSVNSSVAISALHASILLSVVETDAVNELIRRFENEATSINDKLTIAAILSYKRLYSQDKIYEFLKQYLTAGRFNTKFERTFEAVMTFADIVREKISGSISSYDSGIKEDLAKLKEKTGFDEELDKLLKRFGLSQDSPSALPRQEGEQVPSLDDADLVVVAKLLADLENILPAMALRHPFILGGYSSIGKSALVEFVAALLQRKYDSMNLSIGRDSSYLVGEFRPDSDGHNGGKISWVFSPLVEGGREQDGEGWIVTLEEINLARSAVLERLNTLLDRNGYTEVPEYREGYVINRDENFILAGTMNPLDEPGTKVLSPAFMDRWMVFWVNDYCQEELKQIVRVLYGLSENLASRLVDFHMEIQKAAQERTLGAGRVAAYSYNMRHLLRVGSFLKFYSLGDMSEADAIGKLEEMVRVVYDIIPSDINNPDRQKFEQLIAAYIRR